MGLNVTTFGGMKTFQKKKPLHLNWENNDNADLVNLEVKFVFCLSTDVEPK